MKKKWNGAERDPTAWQGSRIALVHDYLIKAGGAEAVTQAIWAMCPDAVLFTSVFSPQTLPEFWQDQHQAQRIQPSVLQPLARILGILREDYHTRLKWILPLMPWAFGRLDLSTYDCVISSSHAFAKGIRTRGLHLCYLHTPTRYLWGSEGIYFERGLVSTWQRPLARRVLAMLKKLDFAAAQQPQVLIANSHHIRRRIEQVYQRSAQVIHPPVDVDSFQPVPDPKADYDLVVSRLVPYKRVDRAVLAYTHLQKPLLVVGQGPELERLKAMAGSTIRFLPHQSQAELRQLYAHCRFLVFPWEEDFGIIPVEAQACGRPVIGLDAGGLQDTVIPHKTGIRFTKASVEGLIGGIQQAERQAWDPQVIRAHAETFSTQRFWAELDRAIQSAWQAFGRDPLSWKAK